MGAEEGAPVPGLPPERGGPAREGAAARVERGPGEVRPATGGAAVPARGAGWIGKGARRDRLGDGVEGNRRQGRSADLFTEHRREVYAPVPGEQGGPLRRCLPESIRAPGSWLLASARRRRGRQTVRRDAGTVGMGRDRRPAG